MKAARWLSGLSAGLLFGLGLAISQMSNPQKVLSFLTLGPGWDPSLILVMAAAVAVTLVGYRWMRGRKPRFDSQLHEPAPSAVDRRLLVGAALFGLGWGLAGFCPGPAIAGLSSGSAEPWIFLLSMLGGSALASRL